MKRRHFTAIAALGSAAALLPAASQAQVTDLNDAINKAGRQRMLSQRMAKSYLAEGEGVAPELAQRTLAGSMALFDRQLVELKVFAPLPEIKSTYGKLEGVWSDYKAALVGSKPAKAQAETVLELAGKVLALAHQGTVQLEKVSGKPVGHLVNVSGRQRMLSQRMAAFYLSTSWGVQAATSTTEMKKARDEFVAAHDVLKKAPEATPAIKAELELAEIQFSFFDDALRTLRPGAPDTGQMTNVFTTSERILQVMDGVTGMYSKLS
ncbi:type IV pili methyl-accepting chemotaxis transducer N-terminal domain-containing protein [Methylibium sp.]|uniref:type IV pili methyl-accepting chemotaxis transducer N-terminal domain-containing protein n=1 Tax=Methylibium sp. TaxID=2067992 RepID=UPI003D145928